MVTVIKKYRRRTKDAHRMGLKIQYGGVILPAYLAALNRHPSFVDFLKDYNPRPAHVDEDDALKIMDPFLCDMERGVNTLRDIRAPEASHRNGTDRYQALLLDIGETCPEVPSKYYDDDDDDDVTSAAAVATGTKNPAHLDIECQGKPNGKECKRFVGARSLAKMGLLEKAKAGETFPSILCDGCAMIMHKSPDGIPMKNGPNRKSNTKAGRRLIAQLGINSQRAAASKPTTGMQATIDSLQSQISDLKDFKSHDTDELNDASSQLSSGSSGSSRSSGHSGAMVPLEVALQWKQRAHQQPIGALGVSNAILDKGSVLSADEFHRIMNDG